MASLRNNNRDAFKRYGDSHSDNACATCADDHGYSNHTGTTGSDDHRGSYDAYAACQGDHQEGQSAAPAVYQGRSAYAERKLSAHRHQEGVTKVQAEEA